MPTKEQVIEVLKKCQDPEIHLDIYTLELVYDIQTTENSVYVKMTLTSPACPYGPQLIDEIKRKLGEMAGVNTMYVDVVFSPPWQPSQELRDMLMAGML